MTQSPAVVETVAHNVLTCTLHIKLLHIKLLNEAMQSQLICSFSGPRAWKLTAFQLNITLPQIRGTKRKEKV